MKSISRRNFVEVAGAASAAAVLAGCSSSSDDSGSSADTETEEAEEEEEASYELLEDGVLTVATSPDFPPFENLDDDGNYIGFDIDVMEAVGEQLGLEVEFTTIQFDGIIAAIAAGGQADCAISGITVTSEREEEVDFTDSYYVDDQCVIAMQDNTDVTEDTYADALNQESVIIAVQSGTTGESWAGENFPEATIQSYGNATDCFAAMQAGQADAVVTNLTVGESMLSAYEDAQIVGMSATGEEYAIAVSQDNPELTEALNEALAALDEDGTIDELAAEWMSEASE